jgi:alpha-glucosidase
VPSPIDQIPVFVKGGAIISSRQIVQYSDQEPINPLTFDVYPGETTSSSVYYEDDGVTFNYQKGMDHLRTLIGTHDRNASTLRLSQPRGTYRPPSREIVVIFHAAGTQPASVMVDNQRLPSSQWSYDGVLNTVKVAIPDTFSEQTIIVRY